MFILHVFFFTLFLSTLSTTSTKQPQIIYHAPYIRPTIPPNFLHFFPNDFYKNVTFTTVRIDSSGAIYVAFPRFRDNVPFTLGKFDPKTKEFTAFPSWDVNHCNGSERENCFNNIVTFEIDGDDNIWIFDNPITKDEDYAIYIYSIPDEKFTTKKILSKSDLEIHENSMLIDVTLDVENSIAYIVDSGNKDYFMSENSLSEFGNSTQSALVLYDLDTDLVKRILRNENSNRHSRFNRKCSTEIFLNSIGLNCDYSILYLSYDNLNKIYKINTDILLMYNDNKFVNKSLKDVGELYEFNNNDINLKFHSIYLSNINNVYVINTKNNSLLRISENEFDSNQQNFSHNNKMILQKVWKSTTNISYPYDISFDHDSVYVISNNFCKWKEESQLDYKNLYNFVIAKMKVNEGQSISGCNFLGYRIGLIEIITSSSFAIGLLVSILISLMGDWFVMVIVGKKKATEKKEREENERKQREKKEEKKRRKRERKKMEDEKKPLLENEK